MLWSILAATGCAASPSPASHLLRSVPPLEPREFARLQALIKPGPGEEAFRKIPWLTSLSAARRRASAEDKPILAFLMSGHPLGCT